MFCCPLILSSLFSRKWANLVEHYPMISFICSSVVRVSLAVQDCRILVFTVSRTALYSCCNLSNFWCISLRSTANTDLCLSASAAAASAFPLDSISCSNLSKVLLCSARSCSVLSSRVSDNLFFSVWKLVICCWKREQNQCSTPDFFH